MIERAGGYYGTVFQGGCGVTQEDPLCPTIFNVVVDVVVRHWVTVVVEGTEEWGERGQEGRDQAALFYLNNGMVDSSDPRWFQGAFNTLIGLFDKVGLRTNVGKTVGMVCHPCKVAGNQSEAAYRRQIMGEGPTYREQQKGGDGGRIYGGSQDDLAWASGRGAAELENLGHGGRAADISHGLPGKGRPAELPGGGMFRTSGDEDGDAGPFPILSCPRHRGHSGGGNPPPTHGAPGVTC